MDPYAMPNGGFLQLEVGNTGGWASGINVAISLMLDRHPVQGSASTFIRTSLRERDSE